MSTMRRSPFVAGLAALIVLQGNMLLSLYAGVPPHPPAQTPLFGIGPFVGAALAAALVALCLDDRSDWGRRGTGALAALMALVSFGPQKILDAQFPLIWPSVLAGFAAAIVVLYAAARPSAPAGG